jgi:hypothetical protein
MVRRNTEPLLILVATGIFLLVVSGVMHVFPGETPPAAVTRIAPVADTARPVNVKASTDSLQAIFNDTDSSSSNYTGLEIFYQSLQKIETDRALIHIAYFGDSMIEGDLVTQPLRRSIQRRFGGYGIGFIPVTTPLPGFRRTVLQSFNDNWDVYSFVHPRNPEGVTPGISGYVYISEKGAEAKFVAPRGCYPYHSADIIFGGKNTITVEVVTDTLASLVTLTPEKPVSAYSLTRDTAFSSLTINVRSSEPGVFYGVNFEYGPGVYVDNYAFRGNSGLPLTMIPENIFSGFNTTLRNKLLIIHYGLNVFVPGVVDYHWYELAMQNVIRHVKQASPGVSILVVSMPDRSALIGGEYHTPAGLPEFIQLQQRVAASQHVAFFNLYKAMGGANSMKQWVEGQPKLAGEDYTHPNGAGAAKIASLIYDFLIKGYDFYQQKPDTTITSKSPGSSI